ncbi:MAG TPA: tRNA (adenine-N1)-methyltransferase [Acidimicrobiaceae bacterium]|nr:tRNA (adenine-N1)-methyltransferase [Acidimicrobiaceae bacterium]
MTSHQLAAGELVLLLDSKARRYLVTLTEGKEFHSHSGYITHAEIIGAYEGDTLRSTRGASYTVMRPTLSEFILKMPRGAQVIYPKDIGPILMMADLGPGLRVLESGVGSGALSMAMLRCGAEIVGYEIREEFADRARENVAKFLGEGVLDRYRIELRDCYEGIDEHDLDRVILDLPEPWKAVPHAATALRPGGLILGYSPSIVQVIQFRNALKAHRFVLPETIEVLNRGWYLEGAAVRPDHRMVAHTGFLTVARRGPRLDPLTEVVTDELLDLLGVQDEEQPS